MNASQATVSDHSDWTVTMNWNDGVHGFEATAGLPCHFYILLKIPQMSLKLLFMKGP
jgi:hypothetical protein